MSEDNNTRGTAGSPTQDQFDIVEAGRKSQKEQLQANAALQLDLDPHHRRSRSHHLHHTNQKNYNEAMAIDPAQLEQLKQEQLLMYRGTLFADLSRKYLSNGQVAQTVQQRFGDESKVIQNNLFQAIEGRDLQFFKSQTKLLTDLQMHQLVFARDKLGFTLLQSAVFYGQLEILKSITHLVKESSFKILKSFLEVQQSRRNQHKAEDPQQTVTEDQIAQQVNQVISNWVNQRTTSFDGWTALHLACRQSAQMFLFLVEELGADLTMKNLKDITLMHKAAYDDNTYVLTYLVEKSTCSVHEVDQQGNTPLHFACDHKSEFAQSWLLAFGAEINAVNADGDTPLHLLVKQPHRLDSSKLPRELIFKGADRDLTYKAGKTPLDVLREECYELQSNGGSSLGKSFQRELEDMLGKQPRYVPCFHLKQPIQKVEQSQWMVYFYAFLLSLTFAAMWQYLFPFVNFHYYGLPLTTLFCLQSAAYIATVSKDPGIVWRSEKISFLKLNQYFKPRYVCPTCRVLKPKDSLHCFVCNKCVDRQDHHCPWINQCVGIGNHNCFLTFLIVLWLYLLYTIVTCATHALNPPYLLKRHATYPLFLASPHGFHPSSPLTFNSILVLILALSTVFFLPLTLLLIVQCLNYLEGQTTGARFKSNTLKNRTSKFSKVSGLEIVELDGQDYAREALLDFEENGRLIGFGVQVKASNGEHITIPTLNLEGCQNYAVANDYGPVVNHDGQFSGAINDQMNGEQEISSFAISEMDDSIEKDPRFGRKNAEALLIQRTSKESRRNSRSTSFKCTKLKNFIKFWNARSFDQDEMMEKEMGIDTNFLKLTPREKIIKDL